MKNKLNILITSLSALIFILSIYIIIGSSIAYKNNELFRIFGYSYALVPTSSMEGENPDSFNKGSIVILYNTPYEEITVGDVIVYQSKDNILVIHRIVEATDQGYIVQGDNNFDVDDELLTKDNYQAKYVRHFSFFNIGLWLMDIRNVLLLLLILGLFIAVMYQVIQIIITIKKKELEELKKKLEEDTEDEQ